MCQGPHKMTWRARFGPRALCLTPLLNDPDPLQSFYVSSLSIFVENELTLLCEEQWLGLKADITFSVNVCVSVFQRAVCTSPPSLSDTVTFDLAAHNGSLLRCEVNVTPDPGFRLSISHNGSELQTADSEPGDARAAPHYVTLSETVPLRGEGEYECQLHLNRDLITKSVFYHLPGNNLSTEDDKITLKIFSFIRTAYPLRVHTEGLPRPGIEPTTSWPKPPGSPILFTQLL